MSLHVTHPHSPHVTAHNTLSLSPLAVLGSPALYKSPLVCRAGHTHSTVLVTVLTKPLVSLQWISGVYCTKLLRVMAAPPPPLTGNRQSVELTVFQENRSIIHRGILNNVQDIAAHAFSRYLLPCSVFRDITEVYQFTADQRTDLLLSELESRITVQAAALTQFLDVLNESDDCYIPLVRTISEFLYCDHAQICMNQRRRCQYRGYNCHTALNQLSKRRRKLPQGSLSPYIIYTGSAIIPSMSSHEAHPRSTATGRRIDGVAVGLFGQRF